MRDTFPQHDATQGRTIAIGDIHGCARALDALLDAVRPTVADCIVLLGDYVDRGLESREVMQTLVALANTCRVVPLLGNHEEMMLSVISDRASPERWLKFGGIATLDSYGFSGDFSVFPDTHLAFLHSCRTHWETDSHIFVHANYDAHQPLAQQNDWTRRWKTLRQEVPPPHQSGKTAILGHTPDLAGEIFDIGHLQCIDTYCYGGGWLTAMEVASGEVWQVCRKGKLRRTGAGASRPEHVAY